MYVSHPLRLTLPPPLSLHRLSWTIFITWTCTVFGFLWSLYLGVITRLAQQSARPRASYAGASALDLGQAASGTGGGLSAVPIDGSARIVTDTVGGVLGAGIGKSPWWESVRSLVLLAVCMAFLPSWKTVSKASSLGTLLGPAILTLFGVFAGLTVQMIRLPVLWCDRCKVLNVRVSDTVYA